VVVDAILETFFYDTNYVELLEDVGLADRGIADDADDNVLPHSPLLAEYERLYRIVERHQAQRSGARAIRVSSDPVRSAAARRAVLIRSEGHCENPRCPGQPSDLTDKGAPILEVDHIHELADGGPDDPEQMVALCPNCHAVKTRGRTREQLREVLLDISKQRHVA
jgi:5-methylcytosine-specific restriction enzyme A